MMAPLPHCGERDFCRCSRKFLDIVSFTIRIWRHALYNCLCSFQNVNRLYSKPSADQSVNWSIQPVTNVVANAGSTQLSGKASQVSNGTYQVKVQINGGSIYTTSLDSNGHFQFANLPTFQGGETVSLGPRAQQSHWPAFANQFYCFSNSCLFCASTNGHANH